MNESNQTTKPKSFSPKDPPKLDPPKDDPITIEALASFDGNQPIATTLSKHSDLNACLGTRSGHPTYVAIKGTVFDVSRNNAYGPSGAYHSTISTQAGYK